MRNSNIIAMYEQSSSYDKAIFLDVLEDIKIVYKVFSKGIPDLESTINNIVELAGKKDKAPFAFDKPINGAISYKKTNKFCDHLSERIIGKSEEDLSHIRLQRYRFIRELINSGYITVVEQIKNTELPEIQKDFDTQREGLDNLTKKLSTGEVIFSVSNIKQSPSKKTIYIGKLALRANAKKNAIFFLLIYVIQGLSKEMGPDWLNRIINAYYQGSLEKEDIESIIFHTEIKEIEKLERLLSTGEERAQISEWHFNEKGDLYINNSIKPFKLSESAKESSRILQLIGRYIFKYGKVKQFNEGELREFFKLNKDEFPEITSQSINFIKWESGFMRTFESNILKFYKENIILRIEHPHILLIRKDL